MQRQARTLENLLIPESFITPSQYRDSRTSDQRRLSQEQRLLLAVLVDGIMAFKDFFRKAEVVRWVACEETELPDPPNRIPFLFCVANLVEGIAPKTARKIYLDKCRNYQPTIIRTLSPIQHIAPRKYKQRVAAA